MSSYRLKHRLQLLIALSVLQALTLISIAMVLYFRGQWMGQTDAMMQELAATCTELQTMAIQNRKSLNEIKQNQINNQP